jgi:hypothetical protein
LVWAIVSTAFKGTGALSPRFRIFIAMIHLSSMRGYATLFR